MKKIITLGIALTFLTACVSDTDYEDLRNSINEQEEEHQYELERRDEIISSFQDALYSANEKISLMNQQITDAQWMIGESYEELEYAIENLATQDVEDEPSRY